jgi:hypothetical protein
LFNYFFCFWTIEENGFVGIIFLPYLETCLGSNLGTRGTVRVALLKASCIAFDVGCTIGISV